MFQSYSFLNHIETPCSIPIRFSPMELFFPNFPPLTIIFPLFFCFFISFSIINLLFKPKTHLLQEPKNPPPAPIKLPLIGNIHNFLSSFFSPVHRSLNSLSIKYGPIVLLQLGQTQILIISSSKLAAEALKTHDTNFSDRTENLAVRILGYNNTGIVFAPYNDHWRMLRKICLSEALSKTRVQSYGSIRQGEVNRFIESISELKQGTVVNLSERIFKLIMSITSRAVFGEECRHQDEFMFLVRKASSLSSSLDVSDLFPSFKFVHGFSWNKYALMRVHKRLDKIMDELIDVRKEKRKLTSCEDIKGKEGDCVVKEDMIEVLLNIHEDGDHVEFTITAVKAFILDMFMAGTMGSSTTTEWTMSELLRNPKVMQKAQAEVRSAAKQKGSILEEEDTHKLPFLKSVIKETLRLHPPVTLIPRKSRSECEINGYDIPGQTNTLINLWAIGRDPENWKDPNCYNPERFCDSDIDYLGLNSEYIPFGAGRRLCPGIAYAMANIELVVAKMLFHFDWEIAGGIKAEELDMTEAISAVVRRKHGLKVIATPYNF